MASEQQQQQQSQPDSSKDEPTTNRKSIFDGSMKGLVGCSLASQIILIILNVLSGALALTVIGACAWIRYDKYFHLSIDALRGIDQSTLATLKLTASAWIFVGIFVFALSFFGCFGAWKKNQTFLGLYTGCVIVLFFIQLSCLFFLLSYKGSFNSQLKINMNNSFQKHVLNPITISSQTNRTKGTGGVIRIFSSIERNMKCCGLNGPNDYHRKRIPKSCFDLYTGKLFEIGCLPKIDGRINKHFPAIISLQVVFLCIEFLSILLAIAVGLGIPERYERI